MDTAEDLSSVANPDQGWQQQQQLFQQKWPLGTLICKPFDEGDFEGKVESFDPETGYYHIQYEDGDEEDFSAEEMNRFVVAKENGQKDNADTPMDITDESSAVASLSPVAEVTTTSKRGRLRRKVISYAEADDDDEEEEDSSTDDEAPKPPRKKKNKAKPSSAKKPLEEDEDDDFAEPSDDEDDEMSVDVDYDDDDYLQGRKERPAKTKRAKKEQRDEPADDEESGEKKKKSMAESFMPMNNPLFWKESLNDIQKNHEFLDPCGMEATDDIIDSLVGEQVLKIGKFLEKALMEGNTPNGTLGSEQRPLNLGTACSGTDAPALSLTIVQEQMERYGFSSKLHYNHAFSCEKEPFKQSYLARNFDSILYPDIVKLTDDEPRDVYGRIQQIPKHNQFTAGTSCKNFSLLHSTKRMDIEDKGCSGETFLAAVEHLYKYLPDFCIFENVIGAPWEKMQEYVTGRVALATVYENKKSIQTFTAEEKKIRHLMFKRDGDGNIMTTAVPPQVGVRCGAIVKGFYHGKKLIQDVFWPGKKDECTLDELLRANPKVNRKNDTLVFDAPCTYCTCIQKVDTKDYGLPQTRMRTYMFVWKADDPDNYDDDLGVYWQALVKFLENPVKHSLDAFILDDDHDNIRVFREALRGPPGRHTKRSIFQEPDFYTSSNANVKHNVIARQGLGMDKLTRATTNSGAFGKKQLPPHYWREYLDCQQQRVTDMIDILHAAAARDAETHDSHHSSFFWNLSQNVSKEKHRTATPGIAGCISPGGQFFITNLGRPLLGCEKLLAQGIPYFRLMLGNESEVQVGDLAGNAMSLTVVCATLLANIACRQLRNDYPGKSLKQLLEILNKKARMDHSSTGVLIPQFVPNFGSKTQDASASFASLAALADEAVKSSVWCTCETSGRNSDSSHFLCCSLCRVSCCGSCLGSHSGYQMTSHNAQDIKLSAQEHSLGSFLSKLRDLAPSSLVIDSKCVQYLASLNGKEDVHRVKDLHKFSFNLQKIQRQRRKWVLYYNARDRSGVGEVVASFILSIGEISRESLNENWPPRLGLKGELVSYMPAKTSPFMTGQMKPCAVLTIHAGKQDFEWKALSTPNGVDLTIKGEDPEDSERVELGLLDKADIDLRKAAKNGPQKKFFKDAQNRAESRRWIYAENWKEWPGTVHITSRGCPDVDGTYKRASCRQTINQSALWIRECSSKSPLYLVIKPNVGRTGPDTAIISGSISPDDVSDILVTLPTFWQPCDALSENHTEMEAQKSNWIDATKEMRCIVPLSNVVVKTGERPELLSLHGLSEAQVNMLYPFPSQSNAITLQVHGGVESQKILRSFNYLCVPQIMRHIAKSKSLAHEVSPNTAWKVLSRQEGDPLFGFCSQTIPPPPNEQWLYDQEREAWVRVSNPEESREYYQRLQDAPKSFEFVLNKGESRLSISCFPQIAAHYAAHFLLGGRGLRLSASDSAIVSYRLADASLQSDPSYARFKVYPCSSEAPQNVALKHPFVLYDRQQKVVKKMLKIETGEMAYEEIEMAEHEMPGSTGLSVIAKALRTRKISGGVIADAIGAGKTVVSIALILNGLSEARRSRSLPNKSGATLVVVPCGLIDQWANEINKFTDGLNVLCIYGTEQLRGSTVKQIVESDVVIAPVDIVETRGYTSILAQQSGLQEDLGYAIPALPKTIGHKEKAGASGVWIPASSRDPYGHGANEVKVSFVCSNSNVEISANHRGSLISDVSSPESTQSGTVCLLHSFIHAGDQDVARQESQGK
jgi:site-specific DNA-cytosine methylase